MSLFIREMVTADAAQDLAVYLYAVNDMPLADVYAEIAQQVREGAL